MRTVLDPFRFLQVAVSSWMNQRQLQVIDYLREENRVLREQLGERRLASPMTSDGDGPVGGLRAYPRRPVQSRS
jgi:hypothetical protein